MNKIFFLALIIISITSFNGNKKIDSQFILIDKVISKEYNLILFDYWGLRIYRAAIEAGLKCVLFPGNFSQFPLNQPHVTSATQCIEFLTGGQTAG